jgi:hypothetical protein
MPILPEGFDLYDMTDATGTTYGPYLFSPNDVEEISKIPSQITIVKHECDDLTDNGECGHMLAGIPPVY